MNQQEAERPVPLPGLDGSNPLGFLAALGLLRLLDYQARLETRQRPRLGWIDDGYWQPVLHDAGDIENVIAAVIDDKSSWADDPAFLLAYDESGEVLVDPRTAGGTITRDLKPKPAAMRAFLDRIAGMGEDECLKRGGWITARRSMDTASSYGSEIIQDNNGNTKPLTLHFTAGQQKFLEAVAKLQESTTEEDLREALLGPWKRSSKLPSMSWDATVARIYALRATDPSKEKRGSIPGADWLAFIALGLLLATPRRSSLITTGVRGGWKDSVLTWPLWTSPASTQVVRCLLAIARLHGLSAEGRAARGIAVIFSSRITRSDQGGYGAFTPARVE